MAYSVQASSIPFISSIGQSFTLRTSVIGLDVYGVYAFYSFNRFLNEIMQHQYSSAFCSVREDGVLAASSPKFYPFYQSNVMEVIFGPDYPLQLFAFPSKTGEISVRVIDEESMSAQLLKAYFWSCVKKLKNGEWKYCLHASAFKRTYADEDALFSRRHLDAVVRLLEDPVGQPLDPFAQQIMEELLSKFSEECDLLAAYEGTGGWESLNVSKLKAYYNQIMELETQCMQ